MKNYVVQNTLTEQFSTANLEKPVMPQFMCMNEIYIEGLETSIIEEATILPIKKAICLCTLLNLQFPREGRKFLERERVMYEVNYIPLLINHIDGKYVIAENQKTLEEINQIIKQANDLMAQVE